MLSFHSDLNLKPCLWHGADSQLWTSLIKSLVAMPCLLHRRPVCTHINPTHSPLLTPSKQHPFKLSRPILYLSFYSTLKRYKRSHDWDENKITLWLHKNSFCQDSRKIWRMRWRCESLLKKTFDIHKLHFFAHTVKVYGLGQCPGNFVMDKCNNRASYKW